MDTLHLERLARQFRQSLPELLYPTVEEAARITRLRIEQNVAYFRDNREALDTRLGELEGEWDAERIFEAAAGATSLVGFWLAITKHRFWVLLPLLAAAGLLQHGAVGRSPAIDVLRRLGFRTRDEIESEIVALQAIRGDFAGAVDVSSPGSRD